MGRYLRAFIYVLYSWIRFNLLKLFYPKNFKFTMLNLISPFTEISIAKKSKLTIGRMVRMRSGSKIRVRKNAEFIIGDNSGLNHGCIFTAHESIKIGRDVQFGPNVLIYDHDHDYKKENGLKNLNYKTSPVEIGNNVWVGANVVILRGTKIGDNCVIAANSVVRGEYPDDCLIVQKKDTTIIPYNNI